MTKLEESFVSTKNAVLFRVLCFTPPGHLQSTVAKETKTPLTLQNLLLLEQGRPVLENFVWQVVLRVVQRLTLLKVSEHS